MTDLSIHELSLGFAHDKQMLTNFLAKHHLNYEDDIEAAFGRLRMLCRESFEMFCGR